MLFVGSVSSTSYIHHIIITFLHVGKWWQRGLHYVYFLSCSVLQIIFIRQCCYFYRYNYRYTYIIGRLFMWRLLAEEFVVLVKEPAAPPGPLQQLENPPWKFVSLEILLFPWHNFTFKASASSVTSMFRNNWSSHSSIHMNPSISLLQ